MKRFNLRHLILPAIILLLQVCITGDSVSQSQIPFLKKQGTATQLIVDGKPFLVLGGELHNSTSSSLDYMAPVLARFAAGHLNTALAAVCWDLPKRMQMPDKACCFAALKINNNVRSNF